MANATLVVTSNIFPRLARNFPVAAAAATNVAIARTIEVSDPLTPVDTGAMRANKVLDHATPGDPSGGIHWAQEYTGFQNFGTVRGVVGQHFVEQGVEAGVQRWHQELANIESEL